MQKALNSKQVSYLRGLAHKLQPVVLIGQHGVTGGVLKEVEATLNSHELIKVRLRCDDQGELALLLEQITTSVKAKLVQVIGHTAVFFRESKEPVIHLPGRTYAPKAEAVETRRPPRMPRRAPRDEERSKRSPRRAKSNANPSARAPSERSRSRTSDKKPYKKTSRAPFPKQRKQERSSDEQREAGLFY